jgi:hypothetical protein
MKPHLQAKKQHGNRFSAHKSSLAVALVYLTGMLYPVEIASAIFSRAKFQCLII